MDIPEPAGGHNHWASAVFVSWDQPQLGWLRGDCPESSGLRRRRELYRHSEKDAAACCCCDVVHMWYSPVTVALEGTVGSASSASSAVGDFAVGPPTAVAC